MAVVVRWTGAETEALRLAMRRSVREFGADLGVSHRMVSKWANRGASIAPRGATQAALDTMLATAGGDAQERFATIITRRTAANADARAEGLLASGTRPTRRTRDGKTMVLIDEGICLSGPADEPVWEPSFWIDRFPTTNAHYQSFVDATGHHPPQHWPDGTCPESLRDYPVVWVTWDDASAYARWAGKPLPTAQQWEKAARGSMGRTYPWGSAATAAKCNMQESGTGRLTPVDRYRSGVSPHGVHDLCGNVWEWCSTQTSGRRFVLKGSAFTSPFALAAPALLNDAAATMSDDDTGFRCVLGA
ncbi:formylglycine-generating enzyme family protein [Streptomyces spectabilis]|uniref:Formylglycine-generating enzyme family protein n=2 Tax=Streptomyces spectabilis TaxID=68270 RepID=A0A516RKC1_STRST|nr:formylglycine-generating enzyme family protein [Streptomyces spectabilis]